METVKSKNPCPYCGKKEWLAFNIIDSEVFLEEVHKFPIVDFLYTPYFHFHLSGTYIIDECVSCGALVQG